MIFIANLVGLLQEYSMVGMGMKLGMLEYTLHSAIHRSSAILGWWEVFLYLVRCQTTQLPEWENWFFWDKVTVQISRRNNFLICRHLS